MALYEDVVSRLKELGCSITEGLEGAVNHSINRAAERIRAKINRDEVPEGLYYIHVDMAAGLFLADEKNAGQISGNYDFSPPVRSVTEGDVSLTFSGAYDGYTTPEARFDAMTESLINPPEWVFAKYRRLVW